MCLDKLYVKDNNEIFSNSCSKTTFRNKQILFMFEQRIWYVYVLRILFINHHNRAFPPKCVTDCLFANKFTKSHLNRETKG